MRKGCFIPEIKIQMNYDMNIGTCLEKNARPIIL